MAQAFQATVGTEVKQQPPSTRHVQEQAFGTIAALAQGLNRRPVVHAMAMRRHVGVDLQGQRQAGTGAWTDHDVEPEMTAQCQRCRARRKDQQVARRPDLAPLARIQQIDQVYVDVRQPAAALEALRAALAPRHAADNGSGSDSLPASILRSNGEPYPQAGRILFSGINVDAGTGDVLLRILVDNSDRLLLPGMFVRARVPRGQPADALLVPQQAVSRTGGKAGVWVVDAQDHACLLYTSPSPRDRTRSRMPSSALKKKLR